jgi:hypothetical protein
MQQTQVVPKRSHDKVADLVRIAPGFNDLSRIWVLKPRLVSSKKHSGMHRSEHCTTLGTEDTADFKEEMIQILDVLEYESAHDSIERSVLEWKASLEIVKKKLHRVGPRLLARLRQHSFGEIKSRNDCTSAREPQRVASRAAAQVKDGKTPHETQLLTHERFLEGNKQIRCLIVNERPTIIAVANCG